MVSSDATSLGDAVSLDDAIDLMYETGWTDGLPVVPPTADRVKLCVDYTGRDPDEIIAELPPLGGKATVERIAVNAVMAEEVCRQLRRSAPVKYRPEQRMRRN